MNDDELFILMGMNADRHRDEIECSYQQFLKMDRFILNLLTSDSTYYAK